MLSICRDHGAHKVLVTCDKSNEASRKTIIKNGGVLENEIELDGETGSKEIIQRFWIKL
jgi:predicted acetyltransferase